MTAGIPTLTTPRLILRPLELADADAIQNIFPQWEIVRFLASHVPWPYPADGALTYLRDTALPAMERGTEWHWSIRRKLAPERLIGAIGLMDEPGNNRGFWLDPAFQGQGLMTEACAAVTDYWFETLERSVLQAPKAIANVPSRRISERSGMRLIEKVEHDLVSGRLPAEIWEITREEWRRRR
jgi:[ribosomal protein S5]-alanine N-acetyltransferase